MSDPTRRMFNQGALGSLLTFSLLESLFCRDAFSLTRSNRWRPSGWRNSTRWVTTSKIEN